MSCLLQHFVVVYNKIQTLILNSSLLIQGLQFSTVFLYVFHRINLYDSNFHDFSITIHLCLINFLHFVLDCVTMIYFILKVIIYAMLIFTNLFISIFTFTFIICPVMLISSYVTMFLSSYLSYHT